MQHEIQRKGDTLNKKFRAYAIILSIILMTALFLFHPELSTSISAQTPVESPAVTPEEAPETFGIDGPAALGIPFSPATPSETPAPTVKETPKTDTPAPPVSTPAKTATTPTKEPMPTTKIAGSRSVLERYKKYGGAPVIVGDKPLFAVYTRLGPYSPKERADFISRRIREIIQNRRLDPENLKVEDGKYTSTITLGDRNIVTISDRDADPEKKSRQALIREYRNAVLIAVNKARNEKRFRRIVRGAIAAGAGLIILLAFWFITTRLRPHVFKKIRSWRGTRIKSIRFQRLEVISSNQIANFIIWSLRALHFLVTLVLFYVYFHIILHFFPLTEGMARDLSQGAMKLANNLWHVIGGYLPKLVFIILTLVALRYVLKFIHFIFNEIKKGSIVIPGFYDEWIEPTHKIVRFLIIALAVAIIFPYLPGYSSPAFKGISIFLGVIFSLGSQSFVANILAGVILTYTRAFKIGDRVKIGDSEGDVVEKTLLVTRIRTTKNVDISIPNGKVLSNPIINYCTPIQREGLILHTAVTIGYDVPWQKVHELLLYAGKNTQHLLDHPEPFVLQKSLDDWYVKYELNAYTKKPALMNRIYSELHQNIQDEFNKAGVEIMSPHYQALRDGNEIAIPKDNRPDGYTAPPFNMKQS